ncbi:MAG: ABC transporter substrate-binding protein [Proteobacteria bacterium]|nr:ABC transporter substrate-binding protein [Pseudomonadota bacterium]
MILENRLILQGLKNEPLVLLSCHLWGLFIFVIPICCLLLLFSPSVEAKNIKISILMASDVRQLPVAGLKNALATHSTEEGHTFKYEIKNAAGDRKQLATMAAEIIAAKPDVAIAGGGIEADALLVASAGTNIPVVFLSVSSAVERGIVASMVSSGNNFTGIDTNDTQLTAKRLWFIRKILPDAKKVLCFHVPSIVPSRQALAVARLSAKELGFELQVVEVESDADIKRAAGELSRATTDVILQLPAAPTDKALRPIIFPKAMAEKIPIFGYGEASIDGGAFASYAGSRFANGEQAARLIHKILKGTAPKEIPIENPEKPELIINKDLVAKLGINLPSRVWRMADQLVDVQF